MSTPIAPTALAAALRARARQERQEHEQRRLIVLERTGGAVRDLLVAGLARRAWIVGSVAWGAFGARSDVDVVLEGAAANERTVIADRLEIAAGVVVDLLFAEELPPAFRARIEAEGLEVHGT